MFIILVLTAVGGVVLLALAIWPGLIGGVVFGFPLFVISVPALGIWFLLLVCLGLFDLAGCWKADNRRRWGLWSAAIMFVTLALLWFHLPQRIAFALWASELEAAAEKVAAEQSPAHHGPIQAGPFRIDDYVRDERGGVFFRTRTGPDGIGPDTISYGFAFRPNTEGTPFGNAQDKHHHLFGAWYAFAASDDW